MSGTTALPSAVGPSNRSGVRTGAARDYFRPDVEGLRAIACGAVVLFHAGLPGFDGGFVGVDIFFVISGFLITGLLMREHARFGRISFKSFYARRARRIIPAAALVLAVTAVAAFLLQPLLQAFNSAKSILAASVFMANWHFIDLGTNYFTEGAGDSVVLHYWSLAVEEQFYFVWPALMALGFLIATRLRLSAPQVVFGVLALVTGASLAWSILQTDSDPTVAYMSTFTRGWEFGIGGLLALAAPTLERHAQVQGVKVTGLTLGWVGLALVLISIVTYSETAVPFPGSAALLPTLGTVAMIASGCVIASSGRFVGRILAIAPMRFIGRVSFAWYLWHWPILVLAEGALGPLPIRWKLFLMVVAFFLSILTLAVVEQPIARWKALGRRASAAIALGLLSIVVASSSALAVGTASVARLSGTQATTTVDAGSFEAVFGPDTGVTAGEVTPNPLEAAADEPAKECLLVEETDRVMSCERGVPGGAKVVLFGDSHMHQWLPAYEELAAQRDWDLLVYTRAGCPVNDIAPRADDSRFSQPWCTEWRQQAIDDIIAQQPNLIFVSSLHTYLPDQTETLQSWNASLERLRGAGVPIVYLRDTPNPEDDIPTCISAALDDWSRCAFPHDGVQEPVIQEALTGRQPDVHVVDLLPFFCDEEGTCAAARNGFLLYRDDSHISGSIAKAMAPGLEASLEEQGLIPQRDPAAA